MRLAPAIIFLFLFLIATLLYSLFFSESGIQERDLILQRNNELLEENQKLIEENRKLSQSIKEAQEEPNIHVENIAREKFNLTFTDEEFIVFEEDDENE